MNKIQNFKAKMMINALPNRNYGKKLNGGCFRFLKGQPRPLDLTYVKIGQQEYYSFLSVSWGALADVDINSEVIRFMGESR